MRSFIACTFSGDVVLCRGVAKQDEKKRAPRRKAQAPKRPTRNRRIVQLLLLFIAAVIVVDGLVGERGLLAIMRARQDYDALSSAIARQRAENMRLREVARRLREDPSAIEEVARRELGLIKPGERVFIVKDVPPAKP